MAFPLTRRIRSFGPLALACAVVAASTPACDCTPTLQPIKGGLIVNPAAIPYGNVPIGTVKAVTVQVMNQGRGAVTISSIALAKPEADVAVTNILVSDCQNNPRAASSLMLLLGGNCATFTVRYGPTAQTTLANDVVITSTDPENPIIKVPLTGAGVTGEIRACQLMGSGPTATVNTASCTPEVSPTVAIPFGQQPFGMKTARTVRVFNDGKYALAVSDATIASTFADFSLTGSPVSAVIQPGSSTDLVVQFDPQQDAVETATLVIPSSDPAHPKLTIPITATALGPKLCITPNPVAFGTIPVGTTRQLTLTLTNCGEASYNLTTLQLLNNSATTVFTTPAAGATGAIPTLPLAFAPGATLTVDVTYAPVAQVANSGYFSIKTDYLHTTVPVTGTGGFPGCSASGTNLSPTAVIAVSQGGAVIDPMTTTFEPLSTADLDGSGSSAPSPETISSYQWRIVSQPPMSSAAIAGSGAKVSIFMELVGDYVIELVVTTSDMCQSPPVDVTLHVLSSAAVHVQLTWPQTYGDLDLHYIGPNGTSFETSPNEGDLFYPYSWATAVGPVVPTPNCGPSSLFGGTCASMNPDWGKNNTVAADGIQSDDASLDVDQQWGLGPENVTHNKPFDGTYTVAVHYYCSHQDEDSSNPSFGNSTPTINIFIQGALAWTGSYPGFKDGYLWQAAQVVVANNATNITVVPLNITPTDVHEGCAQ